MAKNGWRRNFLETTRGQIVQLLCTDTRTVAQLAEQLAISENAVRSHLAALDTEGFVHLTGKQPGTRKPHFSYELTSKAHDLFRKAYEPFLLNLLDVLALRHSDRTLYTLALEAGRRFVETRLPTLKKQKTAARLKTIISKSCEAGVPINMVHQNGEMIIRGCSCPLSSVVQRKPGICDVIARLLSEVLERPVEQHCEHGPSPQCEFRTKDR